MQLWPGHFACPGRVCDARGDLPSTPLATSTAASTDHQVVEGTARCASLGLALRLRGGGGDFAAHFYQQENLLFPVTVAGGHVLNNYAQFFDGLQSQLATRDVAKLMQLSVTLRDGRSTTVQTLYEHMAPLCAAMQPQPSTAPATALAPPAAAPLGYTHNTAR